MDTLGITLFRLLVIIGALFAIWLLMGKRQIGEFSPLDFIISITIGTVAGAGIIDSRIELANTIVSIVFLGLIQISISWLTLKNRKLQYKVNFEPTVMVENGIILKRNLRKVRISVEILLQLLREKDVFDISEVELAILEPQGKLSVLKKADCQSVKPCHLQVNVASNRILTPVVLEGELQIQALRQMGFSPEQIEEFREQNKEKLDEIFVAFMDNNRQLHVVHDDAQEQGLFLH